MTAMRAPDFLLCTVLVGYSAAAMSQTPAAPSQTVTPCPALGYFRNCYGTYTWFDGSTYEGAWKDNQKTGLAIYKDANGDSYVGEWKNNRRSGEGIYTWSDGRVWMGEWREGEPHGKFIQYAPDKSVERMGIFQKGRLHASRLVEPKMFTRIRLFLESAGGVNPAANVVAKDEPAAKPGSGSTSVGGRSASAVVAERYSGGGRTEDVYPAP